MYQTRDPFSPAVPIAVVLTAGLVHAAFEDWMFAVGYYLCVFFWSLAFVLVDVMPVTRQVFVSSSVPVIFPTNVDNVAVAVPGR